MSEKQVKSTPDRIRTCDLRFRKPLVKNGKGKEKQGVTDSPETCLDSCLAFSLQEYPELGLLAERWPDLPQHIRQAIQSLVNSVGSHHGSMLKD